MGIFNNAKGSVRGIRVENVTDTSVTINARKIPVRKPRKCELHMKNGKVHKFTEDMPEVIEAFIKDVKKGHYAAFVVDGKRYGK